jgi:hypothetical protein
MAANRKPVVHRSQLANGTRCVTSQESESSQIFIDFMSPLLSRFGHPNLSPARWRDRVRESKKKIGRGSLSAGSGSEAKIGGRPILLLLGRQGRALAPDQTNNVPRSDAMKLYRLIGKREESLSVATWGMVVVHCQLAPRRYGMLTPHGTSADERDDRITERIGRLDLANVLWAG